MRRKLWFRRLVRLLSGLRNNEGQALLEAGVAMVVLVATALSLFEMSMMVYTSSVMFEAAHQGLRYAIVNGSDTGLSASDCSTSSPSSVISAVTNAASTYSLHNVSAMTVTVCYPGGNAKPGSLVTVAVSYTYVPYTRFPGFAHTLTASTQGRILY
jgi:isopropylmalate/homocitrate/citramalate synthase